MSTAPQTSEHPLDVLDNAVDILTYLTEVCPVDTSASGHLLTEQAASGQRWIHVILRDMLDDARKHIRTT